MLTLTNSSNIIDLSNLVESWNFDIIPSWEFVTLKNGSLEKKFDLGFEKDKYFCDLSFRIPFSYDGIFRLLMYQILHKEIILNSDLDLFFPDVYHTNSTVLIEKLELVGVLDGIDQTQMYQYNMRLFLRDGIQDKSNLEIPSFLDYSRKDRREYFDSGLNIMMNGLEYNSYNNSLNKNRELILTNDILTRKQASDLLSFIITKRTQSFEFDLGTYHIKDYNFINNKTYYSTELILQQRI